MIPYIIVFNDCFFTEDKEKPTLFGIKFLPAGEFKKPVKRRIQYRGASNAHSDEYRRAFSVQDGERVIARHKPEEQRENVVEEMYRRRIPEIVGGKHNIGKYGSEYELMHELRQIEMPESEYDRGQ